MSNTFLVDLKTTPKSVTTPIDIYLQGTEDFLIPLVVPDYEIVVDETQQRSFLGFSFGEKKKVTFAGHAGLLLINGKTGVTKYYEYGRYGNTNPPGKVEKGSLRDCRIIGDQLSEISLKKVLREVSLEHGKSGKVEGVVLRGLFYDKALSWLKAKENENNSPTRKPYDLWDHNCMTFVVDLVDHLGLDSAWRPPIMVPTNYIDLFQLISVDLEYYFDTNKLEITE